MPTSSGSDTGRGRRIRYIVPGRGGDRKGAEALRQAGFVVEADPLTPAALRKLTPLPDVFVIDLGQAPSVGRDTGLFIRQVAATRRVPLVFVAGAPEKVEPIRRLLPDAVYTDWSQAPKAIAAAIAHPPSNPVAPGVFAPFAGVPLTRKLGIKPGARVALVDAPPGFEATLGTLPSGTKVRRGTSGPADLTLWFVRTRRALEKGIGGMARWAAGGGLWIVWPKAAGGSAPDVNQVVVRKMGLARGLVDFKISAIDARWSGLRFTLRKAK